MESKRHGNLPGGEAKPPIAAALQWSVDPVIMMWTRRAFQTVHDDGQSINLRLDGLLGWT